MNEKSKLTPCYFRGKPAFKWGENGFAYAYKPGNIISKESAKRKAEAWANEKLTEVNENV